MSGFNIASSFEIFCGNLKFSDSKQSTISSRYHAITSRINKDYYGLTSDNTSHSLYVGSYGRDTEISSSDIDMLIQLPYSTYKKFNDYSSNGQSALLQEAKGVIEKTYSVTRVKADGQIISVPFSDGINFEVLPAFINSDGKSYTFPNSNNGGSWKITDPRAEIDAIRIRDNATNHNLKRLCKMARAWKEKSEVDISGILIDILAYRFIGEWEYKDKSYLYYDFMTRDFMKYLSEISKEQYQWQAMGSGRYIYCSGRFQNKAKVAYDTAVEAINKEKDYPWTAQNKWREIYGTRFPIV